MSPKLPRITAAELLRALGRDGWYDTRQSGSHIVLHHSTKTGRVVIPMHRGDLRTGTIQSALDQAGLTADELRNLL